MKEVIEDLALYGYSLSPDYMLISKDGRLTGVTVSRKDKRLQCRSALSGNLLFSGAKIGPFLEKFWFAKQLSQ